MWSFLYHACLDIVADLRAMGRLLVRARRPAEATGARNGAAAPERRRRLK